MLRTVPRQARALQVFRRKNSVRNSHQDPGPFSKVEKVFPKLTTGDRLGPGDQYRILNGDPLKWFPKYSLWLAHDEQENKSVIVEAVRSKDIGPYEFSAYEHLSCRPPAFGFESTHCMHLLDRFEHFKREEVGNHYCLVSDLMGGNIKLIQNNWPHIPFKLVKRILLHVLRGIAHMHSCGIVHTDINPDNILFDTGRLDIDNIVRDPYPIIYLEDIMNATYCISNFVNAQCISNLGEANKFTDEDYRPPEIILQNPWNEKVDIWAFGCLVFDLSVSQTLFRHLIHKTYVEDPNESHLWQIQRITGEKFGLRQLKASPYTTLYFRASGKHRYRFRSDPPSYRETFTECLEIYNVLKKGDVDITAALLERCLHVNPEDRPTAEELLKDPFWEDL